MKLYHTVLILSNRVAGVYLCKCNGDNTSSVIEEAPICCKNRGQMNGYKCLTYDPNGFNSCCNNRGEDRDISI